MFDGNLFDGRLTFSANKNDYLSGRYAPGEYEVTITGRVGLTNPKKDSATFTIRLLDPCDQPMSLSAVGISDQFYTIGDINAKDVVHPEFNIEPSYCPITYSYEI